MAKKTIIIVIVVILILIAIGVGIYFLTKKKDSSSSSGSSSSGSSSGSSSSGSSSGSSNSGSSNLNTQVIKKNVARYVRIQRIDNTNVVINLNELVVLDKNNKNVALSKNGSTITAISQHSNERAPGMLIDDDNYSNAHTGDGSVHWYEIDLGSQVEIKRIIIVNRKDCCSDRAKGLQIQLYNDPATKTDRKLSLSADITTDKPTYSWILDETSIKEDMNLNNEWKCVGDINVPLRRNINNDVECMSQNNRDCLWKNNKTECESLLTNKPNDIKPLECGDMHNRVWGSPAYNVPNHWCAKAKQFI